MRDSIIRRYQSLDNLERDKDLYSETLDADTYIRYYLSCPRHINILTRCGKVYRKGVREKRKEQARRKRKGQSRRKNPKKSSGARMA